MSCVREHTLDVHDALSTGKWFPTSLTTLRALQLLSSTSDQRPANSWYIPLESSLHFIRPTEPLSFTPANCSRRTLRKRLILCACLVLPINAGLRLANGRTGTVARVLLLMPRRLPLPSSRQRLRGMTTTMTRDMGINETRGGMNLERGKGTGMTTIVGGRGRVDLRLDLPLG